jgi:isopenicillin N synthase-like dioxygenase
VLVGDALAALWAGVVKAGVHRVVEMPRARSSIVFALRPSLRHRIDMAWFGGSGVLEPEEFWSRIRGRKVNINARKAVGEQQ